MTFRSILDPRRPYVPSAATDLRATFKRIRLEQKREREQQKANAAEAQRVVTQIAGTAKTRG